MVSLKFIMAILSNPILRINIDIIDILPVVSRYDDQFLRSSLSDSILHDPVIMNLKGCGKPEGVAEITAVNSCNLSISMRSQLH